MNLELSADGGGLRHYLNGRPVHCGTVLLLAIHPENSNPEEWTCARYEANFERDMVHVALITDFGTVLPGQRTRLRWPDDKSGPAPKAFQQTALKVRTPELPAAIHAKLAAHRGKYSRLVTLYHAICFDQDCWCGVAGDGDNGCYEWFLNTPHEFQVSNAGWGSPEAALVDVINKVIP